AATTAGKSNTPAPVAIPDGQVVPTQKTDTQPGPSSDVKNTSSPTVQIRERIDVITAEINELTAEETLDESQQLRLQELTQNRTQLYTMLTNLMKSEHEARMAIIRNL
ncbi:MAG: hypothetical protein AAGA25_14770, partial [Planctomycetota bacterium]